MNQSHSPTTLSRVQSRLINSARSSAGLLVALVVLLWCVEFVDWVLPGTPLDFYGIQPRDPQRLSHILFAPFLHVGMAHLLSNTIPFVVLGALVMMQGIQRFWMVSIAVTLFSGMGVWLFGADHSVHLGMSGVIFGYLGFLLADAAFTRNLRAIALAIFATFLYGGMLWGVLPLREGVSWIGHLFGLLGGFVAGYWLRR